MGPTQPIEATVAPEPLMAHEDTDRKVCVVGGCGHVGLPLGMAFADTGHQVVLYDINQESVDTVNRGVMPFMEDKAPQVLERVVASGNLKATVEPESIAGADVVIIIIGTPVDEHLNPDPNAVINALEPSRDYYMDGQLVILRSTVYPGVTAKVEQYFDRLGVEVDVAFCPERIAEGRAMIELYSLPQIIGAREPRVQRRAQRFFEALAPSSVLTTPEEAELAKLFTNVWRYIKFATANQFYMMANDMGVDFARVHEAVTFDYPRAADLPGPGFAAGPCLLKDTMQLSAFNDNRFVLGHSAMLVNEGLPLYVVDRLSQRLDLSTATVGILGMAFKAESDDRRASLSYKLKRVLRFKAGEVLTTDPYVSDDPELADLDDVLERSDVLIIAAPHEIYRQMRIRPEVVVADLWNLRGNGAQI